LKRIWPRDFRVERRTPAAAHHVPPMMTEDVLSADVVDRALAKLVALLDGPAEDVAEKRARLTTGINLRNPTARSRT
jgi:hypothetical protein